MWKCPPWVLWLCAAAAFALAIPMSAAAAPPLNDNRAAAEPVPTFPATLAGTTVEATLERLDPQVSQCGQVESSVWYSINPSPDGTIAVAVHGSPVCQPNNSTATAPTANSVSQNPRNYCPAVVRAAAPFRNLPMNSSSRSNA